MKGLEVLVVMRGGGTDRLGDEQAGEQHEVAGCIVYRRDSTEAGDYANTVRTGYTVLAPYGADVLATDRVRWAGRDWEVDGEPSHWKHPATRWEAGTQFFIVGTEG